MMVQGSKSLWLQTEICKSHYHCIHYIKIHVAFLEARIHFTWRHGLFRRLGNHYIQLLPNLSVGMEPQPAEVTCESALSTGKKSQTEVIQDEPYSAPSLPADFNLTKHTHSSEGIHSDCNKSCKIYWIQWCFITQKRRDDGKNY